MTIEEQLEEMQETLRAMQETLEATESKMNFILGIALKDYKNPYKMSKEETEKETKKLNDETKAIEEEIEAEQKEVIGVLEEEESQISQLLAKMIESEKMGVDDLSEDEKDFIFPYYAEFKKQLSESDVENEVRERVDNILTEVLVA